MFMELEDIDRQCPRGINYTEDPIWKTTPFDDNCLRVCMSIFRNNPTILEVLSSDECPFEEVQWLGRNDLHELVHTYLSIRVDRKWCGK
jgi:hypothetical protein